MHFITRNSSVQQIEDALLLARLAYVEVDYQWVKLSPTHRSNLRAAARAALPDGTERARFAFMNDVPEWFYHLVLLRSPRGTPGYSSEPLRPNRCVEALRWCGFTVTQREVDQWIGIAADRRSMRRFIRPDLFQDIADDIQRHVWARVYAASKERTHV